MALIRLNAINPDATNDYLESITGKPVGNPPALGNLGNLGAVSQGNFTYVSLDLASSFGFAFGTISGASNRRVMTFDFASTANERDPADNGIASWTYGAGYRIGILAYDDQAKAQVGLPGLAASATLENKKVSVQVLSFGMPNGPAIPLPNFATFDVESYAKYIEWQNAVINYISGHRMELTPVRIYASLTVDVERYFNSSAPLRYALRRIQDKQPLKQSLDKIRQNVIDHVSGHETEIRAVYASVTGYGKYLDEAGPIDGQAISDSSKQKAESWIQQFDNV